MKKLINIGRVSGTHHLKGALKVNSLISNYKRLEKKIILKDLSNETNLFTVTSILALNEKKIVMNIEEINTKAEALKYINNEVLVNRELLISEKSKDLYFPEDLIGMSVYENNVFLGNVDDILYSAAHDILILNNAKSEIMIPNVYEFVKNIDLNLDRIDVELIYGMKSNEK